MRIVLEYKKEASLVPRGDAAPMEDASPGRRRMYLLQLAFKATSQESAENIIDNRRN